MAKIDEIRQLRREMADAAEAEEADVKEKTSILSRSPVKDIVTLKEYWKQEAKRNRKLDDASIRKRLDAENWLKAIDLMLSRPHTAESSDQRTNENLDVSQTATYLKISKSTLYKWTSQKQIPHTTVGGKKLSFAKRDLDKFLEDRRRQTYDDLNREADKEVGKLRVRREKKPRGRA